MLAFGMTLKSLSSDSALDCADPILGGQYAVNGEGAGYGIYNPEHDLTESYTVERY